MSWRVIDIFFSSYDSPPKFKITLHIALLICGERGGILYKGCFGEETYSSIGGQIA